MQQERIIDPLKEEVSEELDQIICTRRLSAGKKLVHVVPVNDSNLEYNGVVDSGVFSNYSGNDYKLKLTDVKTM